MEKAGTGSPTQEMIAKLDLCKLFFGLEHDEIALMARAMTLAAFAKGESIIHQNDKSDMIYFIVEGEVEISLRILDEPGTETLASLGVGDTVGEFVLARAGRRSAEARAKSAAKVLCTSRLKLEELFETQPRIGLIVYRNLCEKLVHALRHTNMIARTAMTKAS